MCMGTLERRMGRGWVLYLLLDRRLLRRDCRQREVDGNVYRCRKIVIFLRTGVRAYVLAIGR